MFCLCLPCAADLMSVAKAVSGIELTEHLVQFIITLFDEDGKLLLFLLSSLYLYQLGFCTGLIRKND